MIKKIIAILMVLLLTQVASASVSLVGERLILDDANVRIEVPLVVKEDGWQLFTVAPKVDVGLVDIGFAVNTNDVTLTKAMVQTANGWIDVTNSFTAIDYTEDGMTKAYIATDMGIIVDRPNNMIVKFNVNENTGADYYVYNMAIKPSSMTIPEAQANGCFYMLDSSVRAMFGF